MNIGYARVSTADQTLNLQLDALKKAECSQIFTDTASGAKAERKGLAEALNYLREGDTLVVWRLDRLGRSLKDLIGGRERNVQNFRYGLQHIDNYKFMKGGMHWFLDPRLSMYVPYVEVVHGRLMAPRRA